MKRLLLTITVILIAVSCATKKPVKETAELSGEDVIKRWVLAVREGNLDKIGSLYWDDAVLVVHSAEHEPLELIGIDRIIRQFKKNRAGIVNPERIVADRIERIAGSPDSNPVFLIHFKNSPYTQLLMLSDREGLWRIQEHTVESERSFPSVAGKYQEWADRNSNRQLEPEEFEELVSAVRLLLKKPHDSVTPLDRIFDMNRDEFLDAGEIERAREEYFGILIYRFGKKTRDESIELFDLNRDGKSEPEERRRSLEIIFNLDKIRKADSLPEDVVVLLDRNHDGRIEKFEVEETGFRILEILALMPHEKATEIDKSRRVENLLDELADVNSDGMVDREENRMLFDSLREPHTVKNPFDERLDSNHNGQVEFFEIVRARRAGNVESGAEQPELRDNYPVETIVDRVLDIDGNGRVDSAEINEVIKLLIEGSREEDYPEKLFNYFDTNRDRRISSAELREGRVLLTNPHPVDSGRALDLRLDKDGDGFVAPHEIGIAAGFSPEGPVPPFEELLERYRWESSENSSKIEKNKNGTDKSKDMSVFQEEIVKRLEAMEDKKLAVVGLHNLVNELNSQTTDGLVVFVENAFVNVGKVKVVDRQNIARIMEEQKFQLSGVTDESTAVEIGKLAGADIIVIGSVSYVGNMYYLNIKMIEVETAQILGSSISQASDDTDFLDMCNNAVYKLFLE